MNKYQEALEMVRMIAVNGEVMTKEYNGKFMENMRIIQELVDKATPMKSIGYHTNYKCPSCDKRVRSGKGSSSHIKDTVCRNCYQVLDWSEDD